MIETGTLLQNRYLIEKQIGEGGMGAVYVAIDRRFGSRVAIKETFFKADELSAAFEREAHLLNSLHHPVLPHVSDYFAENNGYFLVMEFIEGEDLFEILKRKGAFPVKDVLRWTDDLLDALDYLHSQEQPIVHRDIKPQNLKITTRGDIILLDFGLAKRNSEDSSGVKSVFGYSRKYSPLEQIQGTGTDVRSDIFSLAATAYHLLTGKPPIEVIARASEIIHGNPDPLRLASEINDEIPVGVAGVLSSALALNAVRRFASAKAMRQALKHAVDAIPVENTAAVPKAISIGAATNFEVLNSAEIENFTALKSFAAGAADNVPQWENNAESAAIVIPITDPKNSPSASKVVLQNNHVSDSNTNIVPRTKPSGFRLAILAALLICGVSGALYFIAGRSASGEPIQNQTVQSGTESNSNTGQAAVVLDSFPAKVSEAALLENTEQAETKSPSSVKNVEKKVSGGKPTTRTVTAEKPKNAPTAIETPRRRESQDRADTRPRVVVGDDDDEPAPDIESIFTGRPSNQREIRRRREERRPQREEMSEEEFQEMRRQRRQERRRRQNEN